LQQVVHQMGHLVDRHIGKDQQQLLQWHAPITAAVMRDASGNFLIFQQDGAPVYWARDTAIFW